MIFPDDFSLDKLPSIGILMANYNYGEYLLGSIYSAVKQTYPKITIIVVDDCSTDNSWQIIQDTIFNGNMKNFECNQIFTAASTKYKGRDFIAIRLNQRSGPSMARNIGIDLTLDKIDYYQILDCDDEMYPNKCVELAGVLFSSPAIGVAYADYDILNVETGNLVREYKLSYDKMILHKECIIHSGSMIKKEALINCKDEYGYQDIRLNTCEDWEFWLRACQKYMVVHIPKALTLVRVHKNNSTNSVRNEIWQKNWSLVAQKVRDRQI